MNDGGVSAPQSPWGCRLQDLMVASCLISPLGYQLASWLRGVASVGWSCTSFGCVCSWMPFLNVLHGTSTTPFGVGWSLWSIFRPSKGRSGDGPVEGTSCGISHFFNSVVGLPRASAVVASMAGDASSSAGRLWKTPWGRAWCGAYRCSLWWRATNSIIFR
jgi:hypothetical protein